jgi:HEXXH motif-containing protein
MSAELNQYSIRLQHAVPGVLAKIARVVCSEYTDIIFTGLSLLEQITVEEKQNLVLNPFFGYWWTSLRQACLYQDRKAVENHLQCFHNFLVAPALRSDIADTFTLLLSINEGVLRMPRFAEIGGQSGQKIAAQVRNGNLLLGNVVVPLAAFDSRQTTPATVPIVLPHWAGVVELNASDPWIKSFFESQTSKAQKRGDHSWDCRPVRDVPIMHLLGALDLLKQAHHAYAHELAAHTRLIVPFQSSTFSTLTESAFAGAIFVSEALHPFSCALYTAEHLLHEHSHFVLSLILEFDELVADDGRLYQSPWRTEGRPLIGMLHGVFVFARIAHFLWCCCERGLDSQAGPRRNKVISALRMAIIELENNRTITFTDRGEDLMQEIRLEVFR